MITADHKVLSGESDSRNNHRYAVVVQNLATQWLQSHPCKTSAFQETQKNFVKFLETARKPKVIYIDHSLKFGKSCEESSWNHCTSTPHRSATNGIAGRRVKEETSTVLCGLDNEWWAGSMECFCYLRNIQDKLSDGKMWETIPYILPHPHLSCLQHVHFCTYVLLSSVVVRF